VDAAGRLRNSSAAVKVGLALIVKRLIVCRNRICRDTGTYPDDLVAALRRAGFLLRDILARVITPRREGQNRKGSVPRKP
jgi:hypothetical protein